MGPKMNEYDFDDGVEERIVVQEAMLPELGTVVFRQFYLMRDGTVRWKLED